MKNPLLFLLVFPLLLTLSCKVNRYKNGKEHGKWIEKTFEEGSYSIGRYKNGIEIGTWRQFIDGKLYRKERIKGNVSSLKFYYPNGMVSSRGKTREYEKSKTLHWYYHDKWTFYNENGKLKAIRIYEKGRPILEEEVN